MSISRPAFTAEVTTPADFQTDDTQCANCHVPQGEMPFDASIMGAHVVPTDTAATYPQNPDTLLAGLNLAITSVTNTTAGQTPTVNFTLQDDKGNNIAVSSTDHTQIHHGRSDHRLRVHQLRKRYRRHAGIRDRERYQGRPVVPAALAPTLSPMPFRRAPLELIRIGGERAHQCDGAGGHNRRAKRRVRAPRTRWSISRWTARRWRRAARWWPSATAITATSRFRCMALCATTPSIACCVTTRRTRMPARAPRRPCAADKALPPQGINFNLLVHRIHDGVNAAARWMPRIPTSWSVMAEATTTSPACSIRP